MSCSERPRVERYWNIDVIWLGLFINLFPVDLTTNGEIEFRLPCHEVRLLLYGFVAFPAEVDIVLRCL